MADTTSKAQWVTLRDKYLTALNALAGDGVSSYSIGDQTFTLADRKQLHDLIKDCDEQIARLSRTVGTRRKNRANFRGFNV